MASDAGGLAGSAGAPAADEPSGTPGSEIKHLVHVILENRSFDSVFGYLYDGETLPKGTYFRGLAFEGGKTFGTAPGEAKSGAQISKSKSGLDGPDFEYSTHAGSMAHSKESKEDIPARIRKYGPNVKLDEDDTKRFGHWPPLNPGEEHEHSTVQLYCVPENTVVDWTQEPEMRGAAFDYKTHHKSLNHAEATIMTCIPKQLLPTMNMLATQHAVCDEWFCSVPTQTWPNRLFSWTGTSAHIVNNHINGDYKPVLKQITDHFHDGTARNIFNAMDTHLRPQQLTTNRWVPKTEKEGAKSDWSWRVYSHLPYLDTFTMLLFKLAQSELINDAYCHINDLGKHAKEGTLAAYSLIEPLFMPTKIDGKPRLHNDQHPSEFLESGETLWIRPPVWEADRMLLELYKALFGPEAKHRDSTLLVITYDEHGGCYDHVAPPLIPQNMRDEDAPQWTSTGFQFERYGVRVPTILVSPRIAPNTILHAPDGSPAPFDHTSLLRSIRERWTKDGVPAHFLSTREASAPTIWNVLKPGKVDLEAFDARFATDVRRCEAELAELDKLEAKRGAWWKPTTWLQAATDLAKSTATSVVQSATAAASKNHTLNNLVYLFGAPHTRFVPGTSMEDKDPKALVADAMMTIESERFASILRAPKQLDTIAYDSSGLVPVVEGEEARSVPAIGVKRALLIGAVYEGTPGINKLNGTINDVNLMFKLLTEVFEFDTANVICLNAEKADDPLYASKANIKKHFEDMAKATAIDDVFVLYYSGHGSEIVNDKKVNGASQVIVPSDCTAVSAESCFSDVDVEKILTEIFAKKKSEDGLRIGAKNVTLIFDSCHSGDMTREIDATAPKLPPGAVIRQVVNFVPRKKPTTSRAVGDPPSASDSRPDWAFSEYCDYVAFSACHSSSLSIEQPFGPIEGHEGGTATFGVFTFYLNKALRQMMSSTSAKQVINWRQVIRAVQQGMATTRTSQIPQLEGLRDWVPFESYSRPLVPFWSVTEVKDNRLVALNGGFLHGVTLNSQWLITTTTGWQFKMIINMILQGASSDGSVDCPEDGVVAYGFVSPKPHFVPKGEDPSKAGEQPLLDAFAVCTGIPIVNLPTIYVQNKNTTQQFSFEDLKRSFPTFYHEVAAPNIADVIVRNEEDGTHLTMPALGSGWMTSKALKVKYAEVSRIGYYIRSLRQHLEFSGCEDMLRQFEFTIGSESAKTIKVPEGAEQQVYLLNKTKNAWYLTLLVFHPDFAIDQRFPAIGNSTDFISVDLPMVFSVRTGALRDGHGNARVILRAIVTSIPADFSHAVQPPVELATQATERDIWDPIPKNRLKERRGFFVVDKEVIVQPSDLETTVRKGLMLNSNWTAHYQHNDETFKIFARLRNILLGTDPTSIAATTRSYSNDPKDPCAIKTLQNLAKHTNGSIAAFEPSHQVVLLTCGDTRPKPFSKMAQIDWNPHHIHQKPNTTSLADLDFDAFDKFMTTENATGFTIVVNRNAVYALKYHLLRSPSMEWTKKIKNIIFLNAVHTQPTDLTFAGLVSILPSWRTVSSADDITKWFTTISDLDDQFQHSSFASLPIDSINSSAPIELFASQVWAAPKLGRHSISENTDYHFFDLPYAAKDSPLHKDLQTIVQKYSQS